ncbi:MAG: protein translocase subunit SecF [Patescibacteria group bacterium]
MFVINNKKIFLFFTLLYLSLALTALIIWGLKLSIDFTGGSVLEIRYEKAILEKSFVEEKVKAVVSSGFSVTPLGANGFSIQTPYIDAVEKDTILNSLTVNGERPIDDKFNAIGPVVGEELARKAVLALILVALLIIFFIAFAFRGVSQPVSSWVYGLIAVVTLLHDVLVPVGVFAFLGKFANIEADVLFVSALLAIWSYSVSDTIVVFDRIRENLKIDKEQRGKKAFAEIVGQSLRETYARSINTSLTIFLSLLSLYFIGGQVTKNFALVLIVGIIAGTYSSIFLASPLLVVWNSWQEKRRKNT